MAQKVHPTSYRLGILQSWWSVSKCEPKDRKFFLTQELFLRKLISNFLLCSNYITSELVIKQLPDYYLISFIFYKHSKNQKYSMSYLLYFLKLLLGKLYSKPFYFSVVETPTFSTNAKILSTHILLELKKDPKKHKPVFKRVLKEFLKWSKP